MSKPEEQRLTEGKPQLVQPDNNEESSSGESDEQPGTSRAVAMQAGMSHGPADAGNQVLQTMENSEASLSVVSRIDPGLIELASKMAESGVGPVTINYAPKIYHHDERQYQHHDQRQYQDNREYKQKDIGDLKNIKPTQVKEKQINPLDSAKQFEPSIEQQVSANNPFDPPQLNTPTPDPPDPTHPKQPIEANPHVEPHTDISEVTNQSNALNTEIPSTTSGNVAIQPTICHAEKKTSGVLEQTGFTQPKQPISASTSQTSAPSTSPSIANPPTTSSAEPNNPQATNSPCGPGANQHQDDNKGNQHIMISYNWNDSKDLAHKISDKLSTAGYKVWIDKNEMRGNKYDKMYEAVDNAYLVLMFLSENYKLSENCKREGNLAADKRKRIIPIITQDNYKMEGWTALLVSGKLYYDFSKQSFQDNFDKLIKEIDPPDVTHPKQPIQANPHVESKTDISELTNQTNALNTEVSSSGNPSGIQTKQAMFSQAANTPANSDLPSTSGQLDSSPETSPSLNASFNIDQRSQLSNQPSTSRSRMEPSKETPIISAPFNGQERGFSTSNATNMKQKSRLMTNLNRKMKEAIKEVRQLQLERREDDIRLQAGIKVSEADIPVVHPNYNKISFFEGGAVPEHETYAPSTEKPKGMKHNRNVSFDDLLKSSERFSAIVGYPGSGKTTLSKRLAKTQEYFCLYSRFMDLPDGEKLKLRTLLIDNNFPELDDATCEYVWKWVKKNQKKCLLLFDGMDQADWSFNKNAPKVSYDTPQSVSDLIANLCCKHFLRKVKLIFTSRPHSVIALPESLRPDATILLGDLPYESMKKLFYAYSGKSADKLWKHLSESAPVVFSLCFNPLLLQLVIAAGLNPSKNVGEINTTTRVFSTVLENLRCSNHAKHQDITLLMGQLSEVAYKATMRSSVVITRDDLRAVGLEPDEIQDIVVGIYAHFTATSRVFDGHVKYFFAHQLYQEFFTAKHMISNLSLIEFKGLVDNQLFSSEKWSVIRRFICGLLVDLMKAFIDPSINQITATTYSQTENNAEKRRIWIEALKSQLVRFEKLQLNQWSHDDKRRYISLLSELNESSDMELFKRASLRFPTKLDLDYLKLSSSEAAIFCDVLRKQQNELGWFNLSYCFSPGDVERLISAISEMPGKVKVLNISYNIINDIPGPEFFAKIEEYLYLARCFEGGRDANSSEKQEIQLALDQLHDSVFFISCHVCVNLNFAKRFNF
ncbi:unnamed protein product [Clavelina lepadiformis]|uniref:TIR domain-containing protein n=1 Tax=Clavelina lepadiformis TaxID=159417 RepID=A0ABP0G6C1_CLALP